MFEFLKSILSELKTLFESEDNTNETKYKKIIYILILLFAICFIGILVFYVAKAIPNFTQSIQENYDNSKGLFENINI